MFFLKDFFSTTQARMIIFGIQADEDLLYHGIENRPFPAYSLSVFVQFLCFNTSKNEFLSKIKTSITRMNDFNYKTEADDTYAAKEMRAY